MGADWRIPTTDISHLLDVIIDYFPNAPQYEGSLQLQVTSLDYSSFIGRIAVGRVYRGEVKENMPVSLVKRDGRIIKTRVKELFVFDGLGKRKLL